MALTKYTFSILDDTLDRKVNSNKLTREIQQSNIIIALDHIDTTGDILDIWFKDSLSVEDSNILSGVVSAHDGIPLEPEPQITKTRIISSDKLPDDQSTTVFDGHFQNDENILVIVSGTNPTIWENDLEYAVEPMAAEIYIPESDSNWQYGDTADFILIPPSDGIIGTLVNSSSMGQNIIHGDKTVIANIRNGFFIKIGSEEKDYQIKSVDYETGQINLFENLNENKNLGNFVHLRIYYLVKWPIYKGVLQRIGDITPSGTHVPLGWKLKIKYNHKNVPITNWEWLFGLIYIY